MLKKNLSAPSQLLYRLSIPFGSDHTMVTTDGAGAVSDQSLVYQGHGSYDISFDYYYWSNNKL